MAENPREKPPPPRPSRPAPPRVASDNEATVFAQVKPKVASVVPAAELRSVTGPSPAVSVSPSGSVAPPPNPAAPVPSSGSSPPTKASSSAPEPVKVHQPNPNAAPLEHEGTMMMAPPAAAARPPGGALASTLAMQSPLKGPGEVRNVVPNSQPPPASAYGPPPGAPSNMRPGQWGTQASPAMPPHGSPPHGMMPHGAPPHGAPPHGAPPRAMMGSAPGPLHTPGAMMPGSVAPAMGAVQGQPFRAPPPPPAPPGIVLQGNIDGRIILVKDPESARATSFRLLRDNLLARRLPRVIAVSSAMPADGKTTCAINLSLALSEGARVLLLDGALAEPELDQIFGITDQTVPSVVNGPWAAPYKIAELSPSMSIGGIVLAPGAPPPRFERRWFEQLLATLRRSHYDFILIDTAAFSTSPTVGQLVSLCDGTVLAVRAGITTARALRRATEQIPEGRAIGVALIDAKSGT
ncbi:MAG: hypothetical protein JST00_19305 [Deltaproteobacteria bacterium]|nr:hypothetical protein [Deltaproteobacteria bacterium]